MKLEKLSWNPWKVFPWVDDNSFRPLHDWQWPGSIVTKAYASVYLTERSRTRNPSASGICEQLIRLSTRCRAGPWQVVTLVAGGKRRSLLVAGDDDEMFMTRSLSVTPKTTELHFIVRCMDKPVAYETNNKRLHSTFCTIENNYWQTRSTVGSVAQRYTTLVFDRRAFAVLRRTYSWRVTICG